MNTHSDSVKWVVFCCIFLVFTTKCLINQYIETKSSYGRGLDTWQSTSNFIPKQSTSYGTIRLGKIMRMEFDFLWTGTSPVDCYDKYAPSSANFFRIGHKSMDTGCEGEGSHYPSLWQCGIHLALTYTRDGQFHPYECWVVQETLHVNLSNTHPYHIIIDMNITQIMVQISGGNGTNYTKTISHGIYPGDQLGVEVPIWWMSDHCFNYNCKTSSFGVGPGIFSNITIISKIFTWTPFPSKSPTLAPTATPTYSPSAAPTLYPSNAPSTAPTYFPTRAPSTAPTSVKIVTVIERRKDARYFLLLLVIIPFIIFCCYRVYKYLSFVVVDKALVLIIGVMQFDGDQLETLPGIKDNVNELKELWLDTYHYNVKICNADTLRCSKKDIFQFIDTHKDELCDTVYKAVIVHILSHGFETDTFMTSDLKVIPTGFIEHELITTAEFTDHQGLIKLIFHHACRGNADYFRVNHVENPIAKTRKCTCRCNWCVKRYRAPKIDKGNHLAIPLLRNTDHIHLDPEDRRDSELVGLSERSASYPLRAFSDTFSIQSQTDEVDVHSNCVVLYGNIENRCVSDGGQFTTSICSVFHKNKKEMIKADFQALIRQIGNDMEAKTNNAQICTSKGIGTLKNKIRFKPS
eukprot:53750_1